MRTIRNVFWAYVGLCAAVGVSVYLSGCGAPVEDDGAEDWGQAEQAMSAKLSPTYQPGTQTGSSRNRCNKVSSGQVCVVPPKKTITYCIDQSTAQTPFTAAEYTRVKNIINVFDARTGWVFTEANTFNCFGLTVDLLVQRFSVGSSGTASNDIKDYGGNTWNTVGGLPGGLVDLTESADVVGQAQKWTVCRASVDVVDIYAKGTSTSQDQAIFDHAAGHGIAACMGVGAVSNLTANQFSRSGVNGNLLANSLSLGEACMLDSFSAANPTTWGFSGPACPND